MLRWLLTISILLWVSPASADFIPGFELPEEKRPVGDTVLPSPFGRGAGGEGQDFTDPVTGMEFVLVKGGCFQMGDTFGDGDPHEKPVHEVCVDDFYMGKYEVTQAQYEKITGNNPSHKTSWFSETGNYPVENVNWNDAQDYIRQLSSRSGMSYRLPTEAEWEYAARSGGKSEKWAGTGNESALGDYAWYDRNSGNKTHPVGEKRPNGLGLYDMSGNVWEWCSDWYGIYISTQQRNPQGPSSGSDRVNRGGSCYNGSWNVRSANRYRRTPGYRSLDLGFRLAFPTVR